MRKFHRFSTLILMTASLCFVPAAGAEIRIAVVDVQRAILSSEEAQRYLQQIQGEFKSQEQELRALQSEAATMLEKLQKDGAVMSEAESRKLQQQIDTKNNDFVYLRQKLQRQIEDRQKELFAGMDQKMQASIEEIVKAERYDLVVPRQAVLYANELYDITRKITEKLNALNKKPAAPAK